MTRHVPIATMVAEFMEYRRTETESGGGPSLTERTHFPPRKPLVGPKCADARVVLRDLPGVWLTNLDLLA